MNVALEHGNLGGIWDKGKCEYAVEWAVVESVEVGTGGTSEDEKTAVDSDVSTKVEDVVVEYFTFMY